MINAEEELSGNFYLNLDFVSPKEKRRFSDKELNEKIDYLLDQEGVVLHYSGK